MGEYYNLFGPYEMIMKDVESFQKGDITVLHSSRHTLSPRKIDFFLIETTEEIATFLALKYGKENIWKR